MRTALLIITMTLLILLASGMNEKTFAQNYPLIDTGQDSCYNDSLSIPSPAPGDPFFGQDAQYQGTSFSFQDNGDGTITDLNTGLMWQKTPSQIKFNWADAVNYCEALVLAGYDDWRAPTIKELWSIQDFQTGWPYLDTNFFELLGPINKDQQFWSSNLYLASGSPLAGLVAFGVNHGTGHIKAYPVAGGGPIAQKWVRAVRGDTTYGINNFVDNGDGTITDLATGLMWMQDDNGAGVDWQHALSYAENLNFAGYDDWRLPNVKELQSIVDYSGVYPAIDSNYFNITADSAYFWSSTSAYFGPGNSKRYYAWYVAFGYAVDPFGVDVHGAGAVRFDTKVEGGPAGQEPERIYNFVRAVRGGGVTMGVEDGPELKLPVQFSLEQNYPNPFNPTTTIEFFIPHSKFVTLKIYNLLGEEMATLVSEKLAAGNYTYSWNAEGLPSGIYFYRLIMNDQVIHTHKMLLIR